MPRIFGKHFRTVVAKIKFKKKLQESFRTRKNLEIFLSP